jgi:uncharacterized protein
MIEASRYSALWRQVVDRFRLGPASLHGPRHWEAVLRNGLYLCRHHPAEIEVLCLFALFHDSCRHDESSDPEHGPRAAELAIELRKAGHFDLDEARMELLLTACRIHHGAGVQTEPTLAVCLDADRLDLGRVGILPDPDLLSTTTARRIARMRAWDELT